MPYAINHIHIKADDPQQSAAWWVRAFNFKILDDTLRDDGVRFVRCESENGVRVNISGAPTGETLDRGNAGVHEGIEHFGFDSDDLEADVVRLVELGAVRMSPPPAPGAARITFMEAPDHVRIELIERPRA